MTRPVQSYARRAPSATDAGGGNTANQQSLAHPGRSPQGESEAERSAPGGSRQGGDPSEELNRAKTALRAEVASVAVAAAERIIAREIDPKAHKALLDELAGQIH